MTFTSLELAQKVGGVLIGSERIQIIGIEQVDIAGPQHVTYVRDESYLGRWHASKAGLALISKNITFDPAALTRTPGIERAVIQVPDADLALNVLLDSFAPAREVLPAGIHPSSVVHPTAILGEGVSIGACCFVGAEVKIGDGTVVHPSVTIESHTTIGAACELWSGVVIRDHCVLGKRVILHPNVVIGGDGFGYRPSIDPKKPGLVKIPHIGNVIIEDDVEIGAGTCVDRAKFSSTFIGRGTKIDNLCQIGHNCRIGRFCIIAGQTGLAGTVTLGDGVMLGGGVSVKEHVVMGAGAKLAARSAVMDDVPAGAYWGGYPARDGRDALKEYAGMRRLPELVKLLKKNKGA